MEHPAHFYPPELLPGSGIYLTALRALRGDRPLSIGAMGGAVYCAIPFRSMVAFAGHYGIDSICEFDRFAELLRRLDELERAELNKPKPGS
ncbi:hypothetical protein IVB45_17530 [Bradyrhizobium sp. 4]|uniref:hypothetical protein n=1 Tax=unclassified Bradyrhizobium TaxID=2631580 RepID=UPI001FF8F66F|nr:MULTISPECIES: hypothetical protein [unclassified Bradyrhizobium]MCK1402023.1 hypothetical protein [Bradyrhizobium sp. 39]MCK1751257.1 hypothetical protein [Bradyrhizobium sp. 135]UPJ38510.1 hypothetical protein IVB45_17530 [Bradyrhizobium sp. 4]